MHLSKRRERKGKCFSGVLLADLSCVKIMVWVRPSDDPCPAPPCLSLSAHTHTRAAGLLSSAVDERRHLVLRAEKSVCVCVCVWRITDREGCVCEGIIECDIRSSLSDTPRPPGTFSSFISIVCAFNYF